MLAITHTTTPRGWALWSLFLALAFLVDPGSLLDAQERQARAPKGEQLTKAQFDALPDDQSIEVRGQRTTKRVVRAAAGRAGAEAKANGEPRAEWQATHTAEAAAFRRQEDASWRRRPRVRARLAHGREGLARRDASGSRARPATPRPCEKARTDAERAQIHQRAQELLAELAREE